MYEPRNTISVQLYLKDDMRTNVYRYIILNCSHRSYVGDSGLRISKPINTYGIRIPLLPVDKLSSNVHTY